jgi:adenosine deaminase
LTVDGDTPHDAAMTGELATGHDEVHPVAAYWRAGVTMTISSDDPPFFRTTLADELGHLVRLAGLTRAELAELQRRTARAAFARPEIKADLVARIDAWQAEG